MIDNRESIAVVPFAKPCNATVEVPGSKSISNRALILSAMCEAEVELVGLLESEDVDLMREAFSKLGIKIHKKGKNYIVKGKGGIIENKECAINVGNAGTIARFLTCFLASQLNGKYSLDGSEAMRKRPMLELLNCLIDLGCKIKYKKNDGCFPFDMYTNGLCKNKISIDARKSGQNISGILMQCPLLNTDCEVNFPEGTVSMPFIKMTLEMMTSFSETNTLNFNFSKNAIFVKNSRYKKNKFLYNIEPDATAASYFITLPQVVGGSCKVPGMKEQMLQGDIGYCQVLIEMGAKIHFEEDGVCSKFNGPLSGGSFNFVDISDTFLTLAAISPLLSSPLEIYGIEHTRKQETDRVSAMCNELIKLGQNITEKPDRILIDPNLNKLKDLVKEGVSIDTYNDHRFAMSFAILGSYNLFEDGKPWLRINNPGCCSKTFPSFFNCLNKAHIDSYAEK